MAQRAWVWASSRCWWCTEKSGVLQSMGSQSQTWLSYWTELIRVANFRARSLVLSVQSERFQTDTKPTAHYPGHFKCCEKTALLHIGSLISLQNFTVPKLENNSEGLIIFLFSASPQGSYRCLKKKIRLINKIMGISQGENQGTLPDKLEIFLTITNAT